MSVPSSILVSFFQEAAQALNDHQLWTNSAASDTDASTLPRSLTDFRKELLQVQLTVLERVVANFESVTVEQVQQALRNLSSPSDSASASDDDQIRQRDPSVKAGNVEMTQAARLAFARLALQQECFFLMEKNGTIKRPPLKSSGSLERADLVEFLGLCILANKLPSVQHHLETGEALFPDDIIMPAPAASISTNDQTIPKLPEKRLERVQRFLMQAVGYDPDFGTSEIKRIFFTPHQSKQVSPNEYHGDREVMNLFANLVSSTQMVMTNIHMKSSKLASSGLSDLDQGGSTRVVSVNYSEKVVDKEAWNKDFGSVGAPLTESMKHASSEVAAGGAAERPQRELQIARDAAALQQSILRELTTMPEAERDAKLEVAQQTHEDFLRKAKELPAGPERVAFMTSIDAETQRYLLMHKLWSHMVAAHGGNLPKMQTGGPFVPR